MQLHKSTNTNIQIYEHNANANTQIHSKRLEAADAIFLFAGHNPAGATLQLAQRLNLYRDVGAPTLPWPEKQFISSDLNFRCLTVFKVFKVVYFQK